MQKDLDIIEIFLITFNSHDKAIYCTPHGKRYHYDPDCGGKNSKQTTWEYAKSIGLTPCQKCVH